MAIKIEKKIVGYNVVSEEDKANALSQKENQNVVQLGEPLDRKSTRLNSSHT